MDEITETRIVPLDEKFDYALWRICVRAAISTRKPSTAFTRSDTEDTGKVEKMEEASNIIVSALFVNAFRDVCMVIGDPAAIMEMLDDR